MKLLAVIIFLLAVKMKLLAVILFLLAVISFLLAVISFLMGSLYHIPLPRRNCGYGMMLFRLWNARRSALPMRSPIGAFWGDTLP